MSDLGVIVHSGTHVIWDGTLLSFFVLPYFAGLPYSNTCSRTCFPNDVKGPDSKTYPSFPISTSTLPSIIKMKCSQGFPLCIIGLSLASSSVVNFTSLNTSRRRSFFKTQVFTFSTWKGVREVDKNCRTAKVT